MGRYNSPCRERVSTLFRDGNDGLNEWLEARYAEGWRAERMAQSLTVMGGRPVSTNGVRQWLLKLKERCNEQA